MKNILVIGGSSGIGLALAKQLSENGVRVYASYNSNPMESQQPQLSYHHLDVLAEDLDLSFAPEVLDGIVYCPGSINLKPFGRITPEAFVSDFRLQVEGAVKVIQQCLPNLKKSTAASVVLFSTVAVQLGYNFHSQVSVSKGAIEGLTRALSAEFAPRIRVNCIAPSLTDTPLAAKLLSTDEKREANAQRHPLKMIGKPEHLAHMAEFLLSDKSAWMTGQIVKMDGGMSSIRS